MPAKIAAPKQAKSENQEKILGKRTKKHQQTQELDKKEEKSESVNQDLEKIAYPDEKS